MKLYFLGDGCKRAEFICAERTAVRAFALVPSLALMSGSRSKLLGLIGSKDQADYWHIASNFGGKV